MRSFLCLPLIWLLLTSPVAQAGCEDHLSLRAHFQRAARVLTILSAAMMPVQDTPIPPPPAAIEQVQPWERQPLHIVAYQEFQRLKNALAEERAKAHPDPELIAELELDLDALKQEFSGFK